MNRIFIAFTLLFVIASCTKDVWQTQFDAGIKAANNKDYSNAIIHLTLALKNSKTDQSDNTRQFKSYYNLAHVYFEQEQYSTCDSLLKDCINLMTAANDPAQNEQRFSAVNLLAISQSYQSDQQEASIGNYQKVLNLASAIWGERSKKAASVMENIAGLYRSQKRYPEAIQILESSLSIWEEIFGKDSEKLILTLDDIGINYMLMDSLKIAESYFHRAQAIDNEQETNNTLTARRLNFLAEISAKVGNDVKASEYWDEAKKVKEKLKK